MVGLINNMQLFVDLVNQLGFIPDCYIGLTRRFTISRSEVQSIAASCNEDDLQTLVDFIKDEHGDEYKLSIFLETKDDDPIELNLDNDNIRMAAASIILHMEEQKLNFPKYLYLNQFKLSFAIKEENTQEVEEFDLQKLKEKFKE